MALDLYQLKTFFVFGKIRNFTRTAESLYVTQSAVSHSLRKLEQSVGVKLYMKRGGRYELTEAGERLFQACERIFYEARRFEEEVAGKDGPLKQKLYLGAPVEFGTTILVRQMKGFLQRNPDIHVNFKFSPHLEESLMRDEVDLIVDCRTHHHPNIESIFLFREDYVVIASPGYLEASGIKQVKDLEEAVVLSADEKGEWWNNFLLALPMEQRPGLKDFVCVSNVRGLINGAIEGLGVGFVPRYTVEMELQQGVLCEVFPGETVLDDHFCIYIKKDRKEIGKNKLMIEFLKENFCGFPN